jgi:hypothetical protein
MGLVSIWMLTLEIAAAKAIATTVAMSRVVV